MDQDFEEYAEGGMEEEEENDEVSGTTTNRGRVSFEPIIPPCQEVEYLLT